MQAFRIRVPVYYFYSEKQISISKIYPLPVFWQEKKVPIFTISKFGAREFSGV